MASEKLDRRRCIYYVSYVLFYEMPAADAYDSSTRS